MARELAGSFFDQPSSEESDVISGFDPADLQIPMGDEQEENEEENEVIIKKKVTPKVEEDEEREETEEEEEEETIEEKEEESEEEEDEISEANKLALSLINKGVFVIDENKQYDDSEVGLAEMVEDTVEAKLKERIAPGYESVIEAMELGIPVEEWAAKIQEVPYEDADLDDVDTQKHLISENLKAEGLSKEAIEKKLSRYEKLDTLSEEAEEAQALLIKREASRVSEYNRQLVKDADDRRKAQAEVIKTVKEEIYNTKEVNGRYLDRKAQRELDDYINKPVNAKGQTQYMIDRNDPKKLVAIAELAKNGIDVSKLTKKIKSTVTKELKDTLDSRTDTNTSGKGKQIKEKISTNRMPDGMPWARASIEVED